MANEQQKPTAVAKREPNLAEIVESAETIHKLSVALPQHLSSTARRFARIAAQEIHKNPQLAKCDPASFFLALMGASQLGLEIGSNLGHAFIIPFWSEKKKTYEATLIIGYKGLLGLVRRSGQIKRISAYPVYAEDHFDVGFGTEEYIRHKPNPQGSQMASSITHFYAVAEFKDGGLQTEVMTRKQVDAIRDRGRKNPVWDSDYVEMGRKTAIRRIAKYLPQTPELNDALRIEAEADEIFALPASHTPEKVRQISNQAGDAQNKDNQARMDAAERQFVLDEFDIAWDNVRDQGGNPNDILVLDAAFLSSKAPNSQLEAYTEKLKAWSPAK